MWALLSAAGMAPSRGVRLTPGEMRDQRADDGVGGADPDARNLRGDKTVEPPPRSPEEHLVTDLPMLEERDIPAPTMFAGLLPAVEDGHKKLFYWLAVPPEGLDGDDEAPLLIWLNGGPGCSSMEGFFLENGPVLFDSVEENGSRRWTLRPNPFSWHLAPAFVLYVDQPVGTGLSFTTQRDYCKNDEEVNRDFVYFLEEFLLLHRDAFLIDDGSGPPRLRRPLYFSGESHAGHYIPSMIDHILQRRDEQGPHRVDISVAGGAIGNGWTDPYHQYSGADAAYGFGLIDLGQKAHLDTLEMECQANLAAGNLNSRVCFNLIDHITAQSHGSGAATKALSYDVTKYESPGARSFPPGHKLLDAYLGPTPPPINGVWDANLDAVLTAIHATETYEVTGQRYVGCADPPYAALVHQDGLGVTRETGRVLDHPDGVRLLFFNGMNDLVCNHVRNEVVLRKLRWSGAEEWSLAPRYAWHVQLDRPPAGFVQEMGNLLFLKIPNAGHMVPLDQPEISLEMMRTFMFHRSFQSNVQDIASEDKSESSC